MLAPLDYRDVHWSLFGITLLLALLGIFFIVSATTNFAVEDPTLGREGFMQGVWLIISIIACFTLMHVPTANWQRFAWGLFIIAIFTQLMMWILAGTPLVPAIKGAHNWIKLGPFRIQPSEFIKLAVWICCCAWCAKMPMHKFGNIVVAVLIAAIPSAMMAKEDMGSALTLVPMLMGILLLAGIPWSVFFTLILSGIGMISLGVYALTSNLAGRSYQAKRIQAWLHPEDYALDYGYQMLRALRSIGSGRWLGKGYGDGAQNRLGWLPEKHTDMIFGVIGEEMGFLISSLILGIYLIFGYIGLFVASACHDRFGQLLIGGFVCLVLGQAAINLAVVLGLMPVTGITLPFFSYGGSSLLTAFMGLGICLAASATRINQFQRLPDQRI